MGIGGFFKEIGDGIAEGLRGAVNVGNELDSYINPFHSDVQYKDIGSAAAPQKDESQNSALVAPINHTVEQASAGMRWLYSNGVSQPLSTVMLEGKMARESGDLGNYVNGTLWAKAWHAANHISPGQAALLDNAELPGAGSTDMGEATKAVNSPLAYYEPAASFLPPGWSKLPYERQQQILKQSGMPAIGNQFIESKRKGSDLYKYGSGTLDFAAMWYLDPTVVAGRAASALKAAKVRVVRPADGFSGEQIGSIMNRSSMTKAIDWIWRNKDNPQLLNNSELARQSALGPRFGSIASSLKDPGEVALFIRVGLGDVEAQRLLTGMNKLADARISGPTSRLSSLGLRLESTENPRMQAVIQSEIDRLNGARNADQAMFDRYNAILGHSNEIDQLNLTRWSFARAEARTEAQNAYRIGPALGGGALRPRLPGGVQIATGRVRSASGVAQEGRVGLGTYATISTPLDEGMVKSRIFGSDGFFGGPVTMVRMLKNFKPNGHIDINDLTEDAVNELRGHLARIPGITPQTRAQFLNEYLKAATEMDRKDILQQVGVMGAAKVAEKHGLSAEDGAAIYSEHVRRQMGKRDAMARKLQAANPGAALAEDERFTGALDPERARASGQPMYLDEFLDEGGDVTVSPFTASRLMNSHVLQDLDTMDKVIGRNASALKALRAGAGSTRDWLENSADYLSYLWKFSTLFRLGYIPRVLSDDLAGQVARLGAASMAARVKWGIKNGATNAAMRWAKPALDAHHAVAAESVAYANEELALLRPEMARLGKYAADQTASNARDLALAQQRVDRVRQLQKDLPITSTPAQTAELGKLWDKRVLQLQQAQARVAAGGSPGKAMRLAEMRDREKWLMDRIADREATMAQIRKSQEKVIQGNQPVTIGGQVFSPALAGEHGDIWAQRVSSKDAISNIFEDNRLLVQGNLERSFSHGAKPITAAQDEAAHAEAWTHAINNVVMQDAASRMAVQGASGEQIAHWMTNTSAGRAYRARLPKMIPTEDLARSIKIEVDQYLHTPEIRAKALEPEGVTPAFLKEAVPLVHDRPQVHIAQMGPTSLQHAGALDRIIQRWYKVAAEIPADRMSRHPLFNQLYEGHLKAITGSVMKQGAWEKRTVAEVQQMTETARRLALKDMRKLVFDIAHRSDASAALRFMSPFFTATSEAFQRWGRILADRPQVAGYAAQFYNAPVAAGAMQDADGNHIMPDGTAVDPVTGKRRLVPKSDRYIIVPMPGFLSKMMGYGAAPGHLLLSQNSMNLVTQGDPFFNPGVGPVVQIPVNQFVQDKPKLAEMATKLGITPFGAQGGSTLDQLKYQFTPAALRNALTGFDSSDERYQTVKLQIMQQAAYEHATLGKPMPSASQIADRVRDYWFFTAASSFLQPAATQRKDAYQFYRDQYNNLRRKDPLSADDKFLQKFAESYFVFAQATSRNGAGVPATMRAVELAKKYGDLIAASPELAALIIGPEGKGPFSPTAYAYELNNPLAPGDAEMIRTKMSATDAMKENQRRLGWAQFTKAMNWLTSQLHAQGFKTFNDPGAENLLAQKKAYTSVYAEPLYPDGTPNPNYNAAWSQDWFSFDARKYDRLVPALTQIAHSDLAKQPMRSDLRVLQEYLGGRQELLRQLSARKAAGGSGALDAQSNVDLQTQWINFVSDRVESDTKFGDLYHRFLQRDMGVDAVPQTESEAA